MAIRLIDATPEHASALGRFVIECCEEPSRHCISSWAGESESAIIAELATDLGAQLLYVLAVNEQGRIVGAMGCDLDEAHGIAWLKGPHLLSERQLSERLGPEQQRAEQLWRQLLQRVPQGIDRLNAYVDRRNAFAIGFWRQFGLETGPQTFVFEWRPGPDSPPPWPALKLLDLPRPLEESFRSLYSSLFPNAWPGPERVIAGDRRIRSRVALGSQGELTGFVVVGLEEGGEGRVYTLGVDPAARRRGIGRQLLIGGLAELVELGAQRVVLSVSESNLHARSLYESVGFEQVYAGVSLRGHLERARSIASRTNQRPAADNAALMAGK